MRWKSNWMSILDARFLDLSLTWHSRFIVLHGLTRDGFVRNLCSNGIEGGGGFGFGVLGVGIRGRILE